MKRFAPSAEAMSQLPIHRLEKATATRTFLVREEYSKPTVEDSQTQSETQQPKTASTDNAAGGTVQRCEDERIHIPGAIQRFGLLVALSHTDNDMTLSVCIASDNSQEIIGRSPQELFALESFTDIFSAEEASHILEYAGLVTADTADVTSNGPATFPLSLEVGQGRSRNLWCAMHQNTANPQLIICEFEIDGDDQPYPLVPPQVIRSGVPNYEINQTPSPRPSLKSPRYRSHHGSLLNTRKWTGDQAAMEILDVISQIQQRLAATLSLEILFETLGDLVKELTGFHRVMVYRFDQSAHGQVVAERLDPSVQTSFKGLNFPASDIPKQARALYRINRLRVLYDRDLEPAQLIYRTGIAEDLQQPLDLTHSYLRAMSPMHMKYLENMAVRSSMSMSINGPEELWGLIICHYHGPQGTRTSFPGRKICQMIGDAASRNIERLVNASRLQNSSFIGITNPSLTQDPAKTDGTSSDDLLALFGADYAILYTQDKTKLIGRPKKSHEVLAVLEYLKLHRIDSVLSSVTILEDFPDLISPPRLDDIAGILVVPLSDGGDDFIVFFRKALPKEVIWAGNPHAKTEAGDNPLLPRTDFEPWTETVMGTCEPWSEEVTEAAKLLCLFSERCFQEWKESEVASPPSDSLTRLLLNNSAHEVRTPLNAIMNYLGIALEDKSHPEMEYSVAMSYTAAKSLVSVIHELIDS